MHPCYTCLPALLGFHPSSWGRNAVYSAPRLFSAGQFLDLEVFLKKSKLYEPMPVYYVCFSVPGVNHSPPFLKNGAELLHSLPILTTILLFPGL